MTFSGVVSRNTSPTVSLPSAVTSLNATGTTLGAPLAQVASVCPVCQEALSDEESAEAPPAAEEARRFRGSVLTAGRGSGWEPADTTVSAEEHAKKSPPKRLLPIRKHREERENGIASAVPFSHFSIDAVTFDISKAPMPL